MIYPFTHISRVDSLVLDWEHENPSASEFTPRNTTRINVYRKLNTTKHKTHDSKVHGDGMGPIRGRQDLAGPYVSPMNFANWDSKDSVYISRNTLSLKKHTIKLSFS